jgi:GH25 family lysozyme M1 (1,4-beta-N-acetylmuramidase)
MQKDLHAALTTFAAFQQYHLFIADYANASTPRLPATWKKWAIWQRSESYRVHSTTDDFDIFNGRIDDLNRFISDN